MLAPVRGTGWTGPASFLSVSMMGRMHLRFALRRGSDIRRMERAPGPGALRWSPSGLTALPDLEPVPVGVLELRDGAPGELEHVGDELDAARLQLLERLPDIVGLDRDRRRGASHRRLGLARCPGPESQLEVVPLDADGQKPRPVGCRILDPLLKAKDVRVEVERLVLVADEHARVEDLLQHCCSSSGRGHYSHDARRAANVTAAGAAGCYSST